MTIKISGTLSLGPLEMSHKTALATYLNDEDIYKNTLKIPFPYKLEHAENWIRKVLESEKLHGLTNNWAIVNTDGKMIGGIGLVLSHGLESHKDEIGYWLAKPFWGQGIMTQVIKGFCNYLFEHRELSRIEAIVFSYNKASVRVLEKAGFEREGYMKKYFIKDGRYIDVVLYAKIY